MADTKRPTFEQTLPLNKSASSEPPPPSERWERDDLARTTRMQSSPEINIPRPPATPGGGLSSSSTSGIEMVVVEESQLPGGERKPWRAAEVWTKRRVYGLDSTFKCVEILDRETGRAVTKHEMLGARLGGGRKRSTDNVRFSYPLPLPGDEAMFMKGKKHGYTSIIERMIVRVRVLNTGIDDAPSWDDIASRWSDPPPK